MDVNTTLGLSTSLLLRNHDFVEILLAFVCLAIFYSKIQRDLSRVHRLFMCSN